MQRRRVSDEIQTGSIKSMSVAKQQSAENAIYRECFRVGIEHQEL